MALVRRIVGMQGSNFRHFTVRANIQLFLTSTKMIQFKCYISVSSTFFHKLYNKNNYLGVKKLFHLNLSILAYFSFFSKCDIFNFFQNYLKKSLILPLENDLNAILGRKKFNEDIHDFLLAVVTWRSAAA